MKKLLRSALALLFSCVLLGASAALAFTDDAEIGAAYREAVAAMTERGVLEGGGDGAFHPNETLTREQGAKIIVCLCLGKDAAKSLRCDKAPFDDVAATRWSAPYIAWCAERGILHGYGNGRFGPNDELTGDQYAKMLLCALGLAREGSYTNGGVSWYKAVREDARAAGLYRGDAAMESDKPITRGQAALLSWNTAEAVNEKQQPAPSGGGSSSGGGGSSGGGSSSGSGSSSGGGSGSSGSGSSSGASTPTPTPTPTPNKGDIELPEVP